MILLNQTFDSFEELSSLASLWSIDFSQLNSEQFKSSIFQAKTDLILLSHVHFGCGVEHKGATPAGMRTFALPYADCSEFSWFGHSVKQNDLLIFPVHGENDAFSKIGFKVMTFSFPESELVKLFEDNSINKISHFLRPCEMVKNIPNEYLDELRVLLFELGQALKDTEHSEYRLSFIKTAEKQIILTLFNVLIETNLDSQNINQKHFKLLKQVTKYIDDHIDDKIRMQELCLLTHVSDRTIQKIFKNAIGLTPKSYILGKKLYKVHRLLWNEKNSDVTITEIIATTGFWHMGQFAADYSKLFGELPSKTIKRTKL